VPGAQPWQHPGIVEVQQYTLGFQQRLHRRQNTTVSCRQDAAHHDASSQAQAHAYERGKHHACVRDAPPFFTSLLLYSYLHGAGVQRKRDVCHFAARILASSPSSGGENCLPGPTYKRQHSGSRNNEPLRIYMMAASHQCCVTPLRTGVRAMRAHARWRAAFAVATGHSHFDWLHKYRGGCEPNAFITWKFSLRLRRGRARWLHDAGQRRWHFLLVDTWTFDLPREQHTVQRCESSKSANISINQARSVRFAWFHVSSH
jgi:hypothetical protein